MLNLTLPLHLCPIAVRALVSTPNADSVVCDGHCWLATRITPKYSKFFFPADCFHKNKMVELNYQGLVSVGPFRGEMTFSSRPSKSNFVSRNQAGPIKILLALQTRQVLRSCDRRKSLDVVLVDGLIVPLLVHKLPKIILAKQ